MNILQRIAEYLPLLKTKDSPEDLRARVESQTREISLEVKKLIERDGVKAWATIDPRCDVYADRLLHELPDSPLDMREVEAYEGWPIHVYLCTKDGVITDFTWGQFVTHRAPSYLPGPKPALPEGVQEWFVGTREEMIALMKRLGKVPCTRDGAPLSVEEFVDQRYGLGKYAHLSHKVEFMLR